MFNVVLDTNVIVSGHLKAGGNEDGVVNLFYAAKLRLVGSEPIVEEYDAVLRRPKFGLDPAKIARFIARLRDQASLVSPTTHIRACPDPDDDKFLECALAAGADYVVTGNTRHFPKHSYRGTRIVRPLEFLVAFALSEWDRTAK